MIVHTARVDHPAAGEPDLFGFENAEDAVRFANVRGGCDVDVLEVLDEHEARTLIDREARERADEERVDRYLAEH